MLITVLIGAFGVFLGNFIFTPLLKTFGPETTWRDGMAVGGIAAMLYIFCMLIFF